MTFSDSPEPTTIEKMRGLRWSVAGNALNTIFVQFTFFGSAFILLLDRLGLDKSDIGFILSLLPFANLLSLFIAAPIARSGYKRVFLIFWGLRKGITLFLLLTPWIVSNYGTDTAFWFVATIVGAFALIRVVEETAYYPWHQEFVPNAVRGKYAALSSVATALTGIVAVWIAGVVIDRSGGLSGFMGLIAAGILFGFVSLWTFQKIPGGAASLADPDRPSYLQTLRQATRDSGLIRFLLGLSLITLGTVPLTSFLPLYLQEIVGLRAGSVVMIQIGTLFGTVVSSYFWGWASDRYGSRPVMLSGIGMLVLVPLLWWILPLAAMWRLEAALTVAVVQGVASLGWAIGSGRLLFVSIVPADRKDVYLALFFSWAGLISGISQLLGGWILDNISITPLGLPLLPIDAYTPLIIMGIALPLLSLIFLSPIQSDSQVGTGQFVTLFLRGNPFSAVRSLLWFHLVKDEQSTVLTTAEMGRTNSLLAVEELLVALRDPRFNVRYEAIVTIARMRPDYRLEEALIRVLEGTSPALSAAAAWALGRMGRSGAADALRSSLASPYRSVRAHSARALAAVGDQQSIEPILKASQTEEDAGLRIAYAAALGRMQVYQATDFLLTVLFECQDETDRMEAAMALACLIDNEATFIQLWRNMERDPGTAVATTVDSIRSRASRKRRIPNQVAQTLSDSVRSFAEQELDQGIDHLLGAMEAWPISSWRQEKSTIFHEAIRHLDTYGIERMDYLLLLITILSSEKSSPSD